MHTPKGLLQVPPPKPQHFDFQNRPLHHDSQFFLHLKAFYLIHTRQQSLSYTANFAILKSVLHYTTSTPPLCFRESQSVNFKSAQNLSHDLSLVGSLFNTRRQNHQSPSPHSTAFLSLSKHPNLFSLLFLLALLVNLPWHCYTPDFSAICLESLKSSRFSTLFLFLFCRATHTPGT